MEITDDLLTNSSVLNFKPMLVICVTFRNINVKTNSRPLSVFAGSPALLAAKSLNLELGNITRDYEMDYSGKSES